MRQSLSYKLYENMLLQLKRNSKNGIASIAKPMLLMAILEAVEEGNVQDNKMLPEDLLPIYTSKCKNYGDGTIPFFYYPYCYLESDGFYHLKWKNCPTKIVSPSARFIRDHVEYAYLDNALWDLLQEPDVRQEYRELIINYYFKGN